MRITRKFEFDAGHRVLRHESKCKNLHGHRYVLEVTVEADELDELGRVKDFSELKSVVGSWIDANWDHNTLLHRDDPLLWVETSTNVKPINKDQLIRLVGRLPYVMKEGRNPTAENMVLEFVDRWPQIYVKTDLRLVHVRLYETPNCWAEWGV